MNLRYKAYACEVIGQDKVLLPGIPVQFDMLRTETFHLVQGFQQLGDVKGLGQQHQQVEGLQPFDVRLLVQRNNPAARWDIVNKLITQYRIEYTRTLKGVRCFVSAQSCLNPPPMERQTTQLSRA